MNLAIDWVTFIPDQLHILLRTPKRLAWLHTLLQPLKELHTTFLAYRRDVLFKVSFNGQVINLEYVLNTRFDNIQKGIYISDGYKITRRYIYRKIEDKDKTFIRRKSELKPPIYIRRKIEFLNDYEFVVNVPSNVLFDINEMKAIINFYKLADKRYIINIY